MRQLMWGISLVMANVTFYSQETTFAFIFNAF